jgi:hypothetical protein
LAHNTDDLRERQAIRAEVVLPSDAEGYCEAVGRFLENKLQQPPLNYGFIRAESLAGWKRGLMFWDCAEYILDALGPDVA